MPSEKGEESICAACYADLPWTQPAVSPTPGIFECSIAMLRYEFPVDVAVKAMKFNRKLFYAPAFVEVLSAARPFLPNDIDAILAVPLHWRRKTHRGFNQAAELARPLARVLELPVVRGVRRVKATQFQSGLNTTARARNLSKAFAIHKPPNYQHVLIVDDIVTTGATLTQLGKALLNRGVERVSALTVARAK